MTQCDYCKRPNGSRGQEQRPYGPGGAMVCFDCATTFDLPDLNVDDESAEHWKARAVEAEARLAEMARRSEKQD